ADAAASRRGTARPGRISSGPPWSRRRDDGGRGPWSKPMTIMPLPTVGRGRDHRGTMSEWYQTGQNHARMSLPREETQASMHRLGQFGLPPLVYGFDALLVSNAHRSD